MYKICHVTSAHKSTDVRIFEKECTSLAKNPDYKVYLVAQGESYTRNNVRIIGAGEIPSSRKERMFEFSKKVVKKALKVDADVYHFHDPELLQYVGAFVKRGKKVIFDSHEDVADSILDKTYMPYAVRVCARTVYTAIERLVLKKCSYLICCTPHVVANLKKFNPNVAMVTNYPIVDEEAEKQYEGCEKNVRTLFFAGGLQEQWSHKTIINAIADLDGVTYELYGNPDDGYLETITCLEGWKKVNYHGAAPFAEVQQAMRKAGIGMALIKPSHNTGGYIGTLSNTKLFETMNAGLPVICSDFKLWKKIVEGNNVGICIRHDDEQALKDAIMKLVNDPELYKQMCENGKRLAREKYNWASQEKKLFAVYKKVLGE